MTTQVSYDDVVAARELLDGVIVRTPMPQSRVLSELVGGPVYLKCENIQRAGSFKIRGAYVRIARLSEEERARGVVAASAGNHAQGVALASGLLGTKATVFMPEGAPLPKVEATRAYGAEVVLTGNTVDVALAEATKHAERTGAVFIHPFDHPDVVAGQGTIGLEIVEQLPEVGTIVLAIGGGGLAAGVALAAKTLRTITLIESDCPIGRAEAFLRQGRIAKRQGDDKNARMWARRAKREAPDDPEIDAFLAAVGERGVPGRG